MARVLALLVLPILLAACGACDAYDPVNQPAPSLALRTLEGEPVTLESLRGHPVVLHLWLPS
jgi:hypothetical protein